MNHPQAALVDEIVRVLGAVTHAQAALHELCDRLRLPAVQEAEERARHAAAYEGTASVLRRRAAERSHDEAQELETKAAWYEARARIKRDGAPMPRELRTPKERLEAVDRARHTLLTALALIDDVDAVDFDAFEGALLDSEGLRAQAVGAPSEQVAFFARALRGLLGRMGVVFDGERRCKVLAFGIAVAAEPSDGPAT